MEDWSNYEKYDIKAKITESASEYPDEPEEKTEKPKGPSVSMASYTDFNNPDKSKMHEPFWILIVDGKQIELSNEKDVDFFALFRDTPQKS